MSAGVADLGFCKAFEAIWATRADVFSFSATGKTPELLDKTITQ